MFSFLFQLELKFQAPNKAKSYHYTVMLRSDSYLNVDVHKTFDVSNLRVSCFSRKPAIAFRVKSQNFCSGISGAFASRTSKFILL